MSTPTTRRNFLKAGAGAALATFFGPSALAQQAHRTNQQTSWVLEALAKKHGGIENIPNTIIVNKAAATTTAYSKGQPIWSFPVILGESGNDTFVEGTSVFEQKTTPAGSFNDIQVIFDPNAPAHNYHRQFLIAYEPFLKSRGTWETLTFHSVLDPNKDGVNLADGNARNNHISNGCIRMSYNDLDRMLDFCLGDKKDFLAIAPARKGFESEKPPLQLMGCPRVGVIILPELNRTREYTLKVTGLDDTAPVRAPKQNGPN